MHKLKKWRIAVSTAFFVMFLWAFMGILPQNEYFTHTVSALQFFPSFLEFTVTFLAGGGAGFIIILVLTLLFGRVYCSFLCPLGFLQDVIIRMKSKIRSPGSGVKYMKSPAVMHYAVTAAVIVMLALGSSALLGALDPFANFGRMTVNLLKPLYAKLNNLLVVLFSYTGVHPLSPVKLHAASPHAMVFTAGFLALIALLSLWKGRLYCNTLCPAGGILSLASRKTAYKLVFEEGKCNSCGMCEAACKANCIDAEKRKVDMSRCVMCFNCLSACKKGAIDYIAAGKKRAQFDSGRRESIKAMAAAAAGIAASLLPARAMADKVGGKA
ncbi:MAG TPA: 4Fe-4S binding protein, partial [Candidatus Goldiibacteriota bacterium]|nr:4Fe-4S binding protein [Candidatus Goldiibacteriota bacterium]